MRRTLVAIALCAVACTASAEIFRNTETGEELTGKLVTETVKDGQTLYYVQVSTGGSKFLPANLWEKRAEPPPTPIPPGPPVVTYKGVPRDQRWLERMHSFHGKRFTILRDKYVALPPLDKEAVDWAKNNRRPVAEHVLSAVRKVRVGAVGRFEYYDITQVIGPREMLMDCHNVRWSVSGGNVRKAPGAYLCSANLFGHDTAGLVDGRAWDGVDLVVIGTHTFTTVMGAPRTVYQAIPYESYQAGLSLDQFKAAIEAGLDLDTKAPATERVR